MEHRGFVFPSYVMDNNGLGAFEMFDVFHEKVKERAVNIPEINPLVRNKSGWQRGEWCNTPVRRIEFAKGEVYGDGSGHCQCVELLASGWE